MKTYFLQLDSYFADIILFYSFFFFLALDSAPDLQKLSLFSNSQSHRKGGQKNLKFFVQNL